MILARYVDRPPGALRFDYGAHGKPALPGSPVRFNLSHAGGIALCAVALDRDVGVDVEQVRALPDLARIARRFFSPSEADALAGLPRAEREAAFFTCWTRKEAYIKALGRGMAVPLDGFAVSFDPGAPARLVWTTLDDRGPACWSLRDLDAGPGYAAAVMVEGPAALRCWQLPD